jgi:hypothetical protein
LIKLKPVLGKAEIISSVAVETVVVVVAVVRVVVVELVEEVVEVLVSSEILFQVPYSK